MYDACSTCSSNLTSKSLKGPARALPVQMTLAAMERSMESRTVALCHTNQVAPGVF